MTDDPVIKVALILYGPDGERYTWEQALRLAQDIVWELSFSGYLQEQPV